ncbi:MAG TPA: hypothetical protein DHU65_00920 [Clostridiales bacterium]|nr:hypothetical protein [Clostridiales bacterium]
MKKVFTEDLDKVGMRWFTPDNGEWKEGVPCKGIGEEKYREGSVYIGEMEYNGEIFYKQGHGIQYFGESTYHDGTAFGGPEDSLTLMYEGDFDHSKADWFYGNGIFYFTRKDGTPVALTHGFFTGVATYGPWEGKFDETKLLPGFSMDMEVKLIPFEFRFKKYIKEYTALNFPKYEYVFFGDSWMDLWLSHNDVDPTLYGSEFNEDKGDMSAVNVGVGGTRFSDWYDERMDKLVLKFNADKFVINLGFNDLHSGQSVDFAEAECKRVINKILAYNKNAKIYLCSLTHCTAFTSYWEKEDELNGRFKKIAAENPNVIYLKTGELFLDKNGKPFENMDDYCIADHLHLNRKGYDIWGPYILNAVKD